MPRTRHVARSERGSHPNADITDIGVAVQAPREALLRLRVTPSDATPACSQKSPPVRTNRERVTRIRFVNCLRADSVLGDEDSEVLEVVLNDGQRQTPVRPWQDAVRRLHVAVLLHQ
jgi:hypothetical protein